MLITMICDRPRVVRHANDECVQVDIVSGALLVHRVGMSPHLALLISEDLRRVALAMIAAGGGAEVVPLREAEGS